LAVISTDFIKTKIRVFRALKSELAMQFSTADST